MRKFDIASLLGKKYGLSTYLEVVTPTTGGTYAQVDRAQFSTCQRLMYRCPPAFSDGEVIDFRTEDESAEGLYLHLLHSGIRFDLVFVDTFHTYECSLRDIVYALELLRPGGLVLIHDCDPPRQDVAQPEWHSGEWCGVTYAAYLDTVLFNGGLHYVTVDADYGCGIVSRTPRREILYNNTDHRLAATWRELDPPQRFSFFREHRARLLHLVDPTSFARPLLSPIYGAYRAARRRVRDVLTALGPA
jgi:hypothetical protein